MLFQGYSLGFGNWTLWIPGVAIRLHPLGKIFDPYLSATRSVHTPIVNWNKSFAKQYLPYVWNSFIHHIYFLIFLFKNADCNQIDFMSC